MPPRYCLQKNAWQEEKGSLQEGKLHFFDMGYIEIILIGVALSADAMSVTLANMLANPSMGKGWALSMPIAFGLFQVLMPLLGYFLGSFAAAFIEKYSGIISLVILAAIGGKMVYDGIRGGGEEVRPLGVATLLLQAIATAIDAFAVGVSFVGEGVIILPASCLIGLCTFVLCCLMLLVGKTLGNRFGPKMQIVGGVILIAIGIRALF